MKKSATANWKGTGKTGTGHVSTHSGALSHTPYSFNTRFENQVGTNPEELVAAAHAGCFSMKLAFVLNEAGFNPDELDTKCFITLEEGKITESRLTLKATIPAIDQAAFDKCVEEAKANCPISILFNTNITINAHLVNG